MRHLFRILKQGYKAEPEVVWFDADHYTKEEADAQFEEFEDFTLNGYPYKGYKYQGEKLHEVFYMGLFKDDEMPKNTKGYLDWLIKGFKKSNK